MKFACDGATPHFSAPEIRDIYLHSQEQTTQALQSAAKAMFPDRDPVMYENLLIRPGCGRAFKHNGDYTLPKWTIIAYPDLYGVMEDGTMYPYCDAQCYRKTDS